MGKITRITHTFVKVLGKITRITHTLVKSFDSIQTSIIKMPASYDDLCQRYESCVKNIQDSIYTLESFMGNNTAFTFNMAQSLGNLDELDVTKEEKAVELQIKVLEEYRKVIRNEKKRRVIGESIDKRDKINELRTILRNNRRKERLSTHPYEKYKPSQQ